MSNEETKRRVGLDTNDYARCPKCKEFFLPHDGHECKISTSEKAIRK